VSRIVVDARHLLGQLPVLRLQDNIRDLTPGTLVELVCNDTECLNNIPAWCRLNGHQVLNVQTQEHTSTILLEVGQQC
jgi:tRNA 2-thiouridine synthesizing protein A